MVYCKLKEKKDGSAVYMFGTSVSDISGEAEFFAGYVKPSILKQPKTGKVSDTVLFPVVAKYRKKFSDGTFPEKLCYEY